MSTEGSEPPENEQEIRGAHDPGTTVQEISGGDHGQTYMGGQFGQYIQTQVNKTYNPVGAGKPHKEGEFQVGSIITVHENCPISLSSRIFNATLHSGVTGDKKTAVKITPAEIKNYREAKVHFSVPHHKNIVERIATDTFNFRGQPSIFIAMELCDCNLFEHVQSEKNDEIPFDAEKYIWIAYQTLQGLAFLHLYKVVHGDLKPPNVLLILNGNIIKLSDFGLSKPITSGKDSTVLTSPQAGTLGWQAPEVLKGAEKISTATDIFPGGLVLYFVFSHGEHAYGDELYSLSHNIAKGINQDLSKIQIPDSDIAEPLVRRMLENDPSKRPTAQQALESKIFDSFGPKPPKVSNSRLHEIINNAVEEIQSRTQVENNQSSNDPEEVIPLGVTLVQLSEAMNIVFETKKIDISGNKEATDTELQEIVDKAMKRMEVQGGKVMNDEITGDEKTSLNFSVDQLSEALKQVCEKNKLYLTGNKEATDTELQEIVDKAVKRMEVQGGKVTNDEITGDAKTSLNFSVDQLSEALKQVCEKNKLHLTDQKIDGASHDPSDKQSEIMNIFVRTAGERDFAVEVKKSHSVRSIKDKMEIKTGISYQQQCLVYNGKELENSRNLGSYNIQNNLFLQLGLRPAGYIEITITQCSLILKVSDKDTVKSVKEKIQNEKGIPVGQQKLVCGVRWLADDDVLYHRKIWKGSVLSLTVCENWMKIFVVTGLGRAMTLQVTGAESIVHIKRQIELKWGVPRDQQKLTFRGNIFQDFYRMQHYNVRDGSTLLLSLVWIGQVFIKNVKIICVEVRASDTVENCEYRIQDKTGIAPCDQKLVYLGKRLEHKYTLSDYLVQNNSRLNLIIRW